MLKILESIESIIQPGKSEIRVGGDGKVKCNSKYKFENSKVGSGEIDGDKFEANEVGKKDQKTFKFKMMVGCLDFLIFGARLAFTKWRQVFTKVLIFHHFNLERHFQIEINTLGYAICELLNQLTLDNLSQWHLIVFFFQKRISTKTRYKTHDSELLTIIETFKTWKNYLKSFQDEVFMLTNNNNFQQFIDTKSLSFR